MRRLGPVLRLLRSAVCSHRPHLPSLPLAPAVSPTSWFGPVTSWASSCSTGRPTCATWPWRACARWPAPSSPTRRSRRTSTPSSTPSRCNFWEPVLATLTWPMAPLLPWSNLGTQRPWVTSPGSLEHTLPALLPQTERDVSVRQRAARSRSGRPAVWLKDAIRSTVSRTSALIRLRPVVSCSDRT